MRVAVEEALVVAGRRHRRLRHGRRRQRADDRIVVGRVVDPGEGGVGEQRVDGHRPDEGVAAEAGHQCGDELVGGIPVRRVGEGHRPGEARLLALDHRERAEEMRRPQGRGCVAAQERLQPGVGGDDRRLVGRVARSAPEERGPGGGEPAVEGLERAAVEDEPAPRRGAQRVERHGVEVAGHRGARVDVGAEEALEGFDAPVELAAERAAEPAREDRREVEGNERAPQHLMVSDRPPQCVDADREVGVVLCLREGETTRRGSRGSVRA